MIFMVYRIKKHKKKILWPITILKYCLPFLSFSFFGQIFVIFTTIFYCRKNESVTSLYLKCRPDHWSNKLKPIAGVAMFLHIFISFITNSLYYKLIFIPSKSDLLQKFNSFPDIIFLFTKMIIIVIFILDKGVESEHWPILLFMVFISGINAYFNVVHKNRPNKILSSLNIFFCLQLFAGFLILFIGKIFKFLKFNGGIYLFFCCAIIIILSIIFFKSNEMDLICKDYKKIDNPDEYLKYITYFYLLIKKKNDSREYSMIMKSLITSIEEKCIDQNCLLKKYLKNLEKGFDFEYQLIQFCEQLFQFGTTKFFDSIVLKNNYSMFLIIDMNNKKKALKILEEIKDTVISLEQNYNIYRGKKIIEKYSTSYANKNNYIYEYRKTIQEFRIYIEKSVSLYYDFFSLLWEIKIQNIDNFEKINKIGNEIKKINKKTDKTFNNLINNKTDNFEIISVYSEFVENILKDKKKIQKCQDLKKIIYNNNLTEIHEKDYSNFNLDVLKENGQINYLLISTEHKKLGMILDCSKNLTNILGYKRSELIGNYIDILLPEIYRKTHKSLIIKKIEENKLNFLQGHFKNSIYAPKFLEKDTFCISKSKLLIPIYIKIYLVNTEENELIYIAEIERNNNYYYDLLKKSEAATQYYILTDKNFIIQSFTPNCINYLNINYEDIN